MSRTSINSLALLAAGLFAAACQESATTAPADSSLDLQAAIAQAAGDAARNGDPDRAETLRHGARALRWGIRPSEIQVKIQNETFTYQAIVVGVVRRRDPGEPVLVRSLVAWTGQPPTALLQVVSRSDHGLFGHPGNGNGNGNGPDGARGVWKDLMNHELWVATAGFADLELTGTGARCPVQPTEAALECVLASYDVQVNGNFQLLSTDGPAGAPIEIHTNAAGVNGVVIRPAD
ncbi:MAG: hypothetical protein ACT4PM_02070 [Gemmatimonadales bacterium]